MIQDVEIENLQVNADEHGHLTEMWRSDWEFYAGEDEPGGPIFSRRIRESSAHGAAITAAKSITSSFLAARQKSASTMTERQHPPRANLTLISSMKET
jgi:hypothetical protein